MLSSRVDWVNPPKLDQLIFLGQSQSLLVPQFFFFSKFGQSQYIFFPCSLLFRRFVAAKDRKDLKGWTWKIHKQSQLIFFTTFTSMDIFHNIFFFPNQWKKIRKKNMDLWIGQVHKQSHHPFFPADDVARTGQVLVECPTQLISTFFICHLVYVSVNSQMWPFWKRKWTFSWD